MSTHTVSSPLSLRSLYATLWSHAGERRPLLLAAYALLGSAELLRLLVPWLTGRAIDHLQQGGAQALSAAGMDLLLVFACIGGGWLLHAPGRILERNVGLFARDRFCLSLLERLLHAPLSWHLQEPGLQRAHRVMQASNGLHAFAEAQYVYLQNTVTLIGPLVALWMLSPWVGLCACVGFGVLIGGSVGADRLLVRLSDEHNHRQRHHQALWSELLSGMPTVLALRGWSAARRWVGQRLQRLAEPLRRIVVVNEVKWAGVDVGSAAMWCALVALYAVLSERDANGMIALGGLYMVHEYARRAEAVMTVIASDFGQMAGQLADHAAAAPILAAPQVAELPPLQATAWSLLRLQGVLLAPSRFEAAGGPRPVALTLRRGRRYALVGPSGAGKSTLMRVIAGLEAGQGGCITLDGQTVDAGRLRREVTLLPQDAVLFEGPLSENLLLADSARSEALPRAMSAVCAEGFAARAADLAQVPVGEGGNNWSGGQRQRLALARGLLAAEQGAVVLLDEPTAALDALTQLTVLTNLWMAFEGQCVVVTLHRLELLSMVDEVIVMAGGAVLDQGPVQAVRQRCRVLGEMLGEAAMPPAREAKEGGRDVDR